MPTLYGPLDLVKNELRNAAVQNLGTAPSAPVKGLLYFDTTSNTLLWWDGTAWQSAKGGATALTPASTVTTQAVGDAPVVGSSVNYAREDHKHGREAFGAITAEQTFGASSANGAALSLARSDHTHGNPVHDNTAHGSVNISALAGAISTVNMNSNRLINLATPTSATDAASKGYVDGAIQGLSWKQNVVAATTANITLSGLQAIDGYTTQAGDRILVKNQTNATENGIYGAQSTGWSRQNDMDTGSEFVNAAVFVSQGTVNADTGWTCTTDAPITVGSTNIVWAQFTGAAQITAGAGLTKTGNTLDVIAGDTTLTVAADSIVVNTSVIATQAYVQAAITVRKYVQILNGTSSPEVFTHGLNTRDIMVTVYNGASPYTAVEVDWDATTTTTVTIRYNPNLGAGYRLVVIG